MELAAAEQHLSATGFGQMLLRRCALVSVTFSALRQLVRL